MNILDKIRTDLEEIHIGNLNTVDADLKLPAEGRNGSAFFWFTGEERFITAEGKVHRPLSGMGDRKVQLTCRAVLEGEQAERTFEATVLQERKQIRIRELLPVMMEEKNGETPELPSVVIALCSPDIREKAPEELSAGKGGRYITVPVQWTQEEKTVEKTVYSGTVEGTPLRAVAEVRKKNAASGCGSAEETDSRPVCEKVNYFPMPRIRLHEGSEYYDFQQRMNAYLLGVDENSMLYNFRAAAGLDTEGAKPMTGWDAADCKLRGHTTGHYLSALALAWAATGDLRFKDKIERIIPALVRCREAFAESGRVKAGYFGAFDEEQYDLLERFTKYPEIWAPWYTMEKMMSGLYDIYTLEGNGEALDLLKGLGDWTYRRLSALTEETRKKMWSMYIAGEFGGMIGVLAKLSVLTGEKKYLEAAGFFYNDKLFYPMERNVDTLEDMHANQHIPQIMGAMELIRAVGEEKYYRIGRNFWNIVTKHHCYRIGGTGETEMFHGRDCEQEYLSDKTAESCASYNLLRLTGQLFQYDPDGAYMDYYENTLLNHILSTAAKDASGGTVYFLPMGPGYHKEYSTDENTCCHGTGMESRYRFMENIYAEDSENIYVNLYVPSDLKGILSVRSDGSGKITVTAEEDLNKKLCLRIPEWAAGKYGCTAGGTVKKGYFRLETSLKAGETVELTFPMELREIKVPGSRLKCLAEGPYMMAAISRSKKYMTAARAQKKLKRLYTVDLESYHTYFK